MTKLEILQMESRLRHKVKPKPVVIEKIIEKVVVKEVIVKEIVYRTNKPMRNLHKPDNE